MKFTQASVTAFKPPHGKPDHMEWDDSLAGFGIRVQNGGSKSYVAQYKIGTKQRRLSLGKVDKVSLSSAQKEAKSIFELVAKKIDPASLRAKATVEAGQTFNPVIDQYLEKLNDERSRAYHAANKLYLGSHFKALHKMTLASIDRATVARELQGIKKVKGPIAMNRARSGLSAFFNWAIREGLCDTNPVDKTNKNEETSSDRTLTAKELKAIWSKLPDNDYGRIVKLLTLTCQRRDEIGSLEWTEVNFDNKQIELPANRTKNHRAHIVPLSAPALAILQSIEHDADDKFVFGRYKGPFSGWSKAKEELNEQLDMPPWISHDLRRTGSTNMGEFCGVMPHVVEAVLNHVSGSRGGVAGVYNKAMYLDDKRDALNKYAAYIASIVK
jgi:integrase